MEDIYRKIKIVPLKSVLVHEGIVEKWAERIAFFIESAGFQRNPIIVSKRGFKYVVLDGMHRVKALQILKCADIMVFVVDYFSESIKLFGWDGLIFGRFNTLEYLKNVFSGKKFLIKSYRQVKNLREKVINREILLGVRQKKNRVFTVSLKKVPKNKEVLLDYVILAIESFESMMDVYKIKVLYIPNNASYEEFKNSDSTTLIHRPQFTKEEVIERTLNNKLFPRKSTRHIIPGRPIGIDIPFSLLKERIDLRIKNKLLKAHLDWCWKSNRIRYYPESVYIFSD